MGIDGNAGRQFHRQRFVRLFDFDPGQAVAEKILALAPVQRLGHDLQGGEVDALTGAVDRHQAQYVPRMGDRRCVGTRRRLPHIVDHASASRTDSERSLLVR